MSVVEAVQRDLEGMGDLRDSTLAASALALAAEMDSAGNSATSKSMCARVLLDTMDRLRSLAPAKPSKDGIDELSRKRGRRIAGRSAAAG